MESLLSATESRTARTLRHTVCYENVRASTSDWMQTQRYSWPTIKQLGLFKCNRLLYGYPAFLGIIHIASPPDRSYTWTCMRQSCRRPSSCNSSHWRQGTRRMYPSYSSPPKPPFFDYPTPIGCNRRKRPICPHHKQSSWWGARWERRWALCK